MAVPAPPVPSTCEPHRPIVQQREWKGLIMHFVYPALLRSDRTGVIVVSFRDLPECLTSGADESEALIEAVDALEEAIAGRIKRGDDIPAPSTQQSGERRVAVPSGMASKAALALALRESGLPRAEFAALAGTDDGSIGEMLDPRHQTAPGQIERVLRILGQQLVVEVESA